MGLSQEERDKLVTSGALDPALAFKLYPNTPAPSPPPTLAGPGTESFNLPPGALATGAPAPLPPGAGVKLTPALTAKNKADAGLDAAIAKMQAKVDPSVQAQIDEGVTTTQKLANGAPVAGPTGAPVVIPNAAAGLSKPKPQVGFGASGAAGPPLSAYERAFTPDQRKLFDLRGKDMQAAGEGDAELLRLQGEGQGNVAQGIRNQVEDDETYQAEADAAREKHEADLAQRQADFENASREKYATWEKDLDTLSKEKIDPNHYWAEKDTGGMLMAGVALALGSFGGGATGQNSAVEVMQKGIDRDIAAQKANFEKRSETLAAKKQGIESWANNEKGMYAGLVARYGNQEAAQKAAQVSGWQRAGTMIESMAAQTNSDVVKQKAENALTDINGKIAEYKQGLQVDAENIIKQQQAAAAMAQAVAAKEARDQDRKLFDSNNAIATERAKELGGYVDVVKNGPNAGMPIVKGPDGKILWEGKSSGGATVSVPSGYNEKGELQTQQVQAKSKEAGAKYDELTTINNEKRALLEKIKGKRAESGTEWFPTKDKADLKALAAQYRALIRKEDGIKGVSEQSAEALDELMPSNPAGFEGPWASDTLAKIDAQDSFLKERQNDYDQTYLKTPPKTVGYTKPTSTAGVSKDTMAKLEKVYGGDPANKPMLDALRANVVE